MLELDKYTRKNSIFDTDDSRIKLAIQSVRENIKNINTDILEYGFESKYDVMKRNMIDTTDIGSTDDINKFNISIKNGIKEKYPNKEIEIQNFSYIPPFEHGVIKYIAKIDDYTVSIYTTWDINSIDLDKSEMDIIFKFYMFDTREDLKGWRILGATKCIKYLDREDSDCNLMTLNDICPDVIYSKSNERIYFDMVYFGISSEDLEEFLISCTENSMGWIMIFNMYLLLNKNKTTVKKSTKTKTLSLNYENPTNEKRVRTLGKFKIISDKPPKAHESVVTIRRYKCASWSVRSHIRTYKNGKTIIIREHTNRRHNMNKIEPAQRVMKFKP